MSKYHFNFKDIAGIKFGLLTVVEYVGIMTDKRAHWKCRCDCGNESIVNGSKLRSGHTKSCGCIGIKVVVARCTKHGMSDTPEQITWSRMKQRCANPNATNYERYGGRGIYVCDRWLHSFESFYADMGPKPSPKYTLGRIDNGKGYEPSNCRWETHTQQGRNKRNNHLITALGRTFPISQWSEETGIQEGTIWHRLKNGWTQEASVTTPVSTL